MSFFQNLNKKRLLVILGIIIVLMLFVWFLLNPLGIKKLRPENPEILKERALSSPEKIQRDSVSTNYDIVRDENLGWEITYMSAPDRFTIDLIQSARAGLTIEELQKLRLKAEEYFIKEILKAQNREDACKLNVFVVTTGNAEPSLPTSRLSFCK